MLKDIIIKHYERAVYLSQLNEFESDSERARNTPPVPLLIARLYERYIIANTAFPPASHKRAEPKRLSAFGRALALYKHYKTTLLLKRKRALTVKDKRNYEIALAKKSRKQNRVKERKGAPMGFLATYMPTLLYKLLPTLLLTTLSVITLRYRYMAFIDVVNDISVINILRCVLLCAVGIAGFIPFANFLNAFARVLLCLSHCRNLLEDRCVIYWGGLGSGKTLSMVYDTYITSKTAFKELKQNYMLLKSLHERCKLKTETAVNKFIVIEQSYNFYTENEQIETLGSNINIAEKRTGKRQFTINKDYFMQDERLPENICICYDEAGGDLSTAVSTAGTEKEIINDTTSFLRQYANAFFRGTEQDQADMAIGVRRIVTINRHLQKLTHTCNPSLLLWLRDKVYKRAEKAFNKAPNPRDRNIKPWHRTALTTLNGLISKIGFFTIKYKDFGGTEIKNDSTKLKKGTYNMPHNLPCEYDTRAYWFDYSPIDKPLRYKKPDTLLRYDIDKRKRFKDLIEEEKAKQLAIQLAIEEKKKKST